LVIVGWEWKGGGGVARSVFYEEEFFLLVVGDGLLVRFGILGGWGWRGEWMDGGMEG
jgi:hypothetical protein